MGYVEGFVTAVPAANKEAYRRHAAAAAPLFREFGATRFVECWGDDIPEGKVTDFSGGVKAKAGQVVSLGWIEWARLQPGRRGARVRLAYQRGLQHRS